MTGLVVAPFFGETPRTATRLQGDGRAADASNLVLTSGEIEPIRQPELVHTPSISGPWISVYRAFSGGSEVWLSWNRDVDVARAPLPTTTEARFYWTGDGEPRFATFAMLPSSMYALGIPKPKAAPMVSSTGGTGANVTRIYGYTFYSQFNEESALSPVNAPFTGKVDGTWTISGMDAFPASSGTGTATHSLGVTTFDNTGNHWLRAGDEIIINATKVAVASTPTNSQFTVSGNFAGATTWARVAPWNTVGMKRRLYRSAGNIGSLQLVADNVGTSYTDTLTDAQILGDELVSGSWELPPTGLKGLRVLPNGCLVGFVGNQVCYSEPFQFHAFPPEYYRSTAFDVVGLGSAGSTVIAATQSVPYVLDGQSPDVVTAEKVDNVWPCLSKRSVISVGDGVMFATTYGMAYVGLSGNRIWTQNLFTRREWEPLMPETMVGAKAEGRIFVRYDTQAGMRGVLVFDQENPDIGLTRLTFYPDEIYSDEINGSFYLVDEDGVKRYDNQEGARVAYSWLSKEYTLAKPVNMGACKVDFASQMSEADVAAELAEYQAQVDANNTAVTNYAGLGGINGSAINSTLVNGSNVTDVAPPDVSATTITLYAKSQNDGQFRPVFSKQLVADERPFKMTAGYKADVFKVGLTGTLRIMSVKMAETIKELTTL